MSEAHNTDSLAIRGQRNALEAEIYLQHQDRFKDKSLIERLVEIREYIFSGLDNVKGDPVTQVRKTNVDTAGFMYVPYDEVGATYLPGLVRRIDSLYDYLLDTLKESDKMEKFDRVLRFAAVVYSLGITIHPYIDGNGQTFRITAISYLSELLNNRFLLPKNTKVRKVAPRDLLEKLDKDTPITPDQLENIRDEKLKTLSQDLHRIVQLRDKMPTAPASLPIEYKEAVLNDSFNLSSVNSQFPELEYYTGYLAEVKQAFPHVTFANLEDLARYPFQIHIPEYDEAGIGLYTYSKESQVSVLREYLDELILNSQGYARLVEYIDTGKILAKDDNSKVLLRSLNTSAAQFYNQAEASLGLFGSNVNVPASLVRKQFRGSSLLLRSLWIAAKKRYSLISGKN